MNLLWGDLGPPAEVLIAPVPRQHQFARGQLIDPLPSARRLDPHRGRQRGQRQIACLTTVRPDRDRAPGRQRRRYIGKEFLDGYCGDFRGPKAEIIVRHDGTETVHNSHLLFKQNTDNTKC